MPQPFLPNATPPADVPVLVEGVEARIVPVAGERWVIVAQLAPRADVYPYTHYLTREGVWESGTTDRWMSSAEALQFIEVELPKLRAAAAQIHHAEPTICIDAGDFEASSECGCRLVRESERGGHPAIYFCPLHTAAAQLLATCESQLTIAKAWQEDERAHWFFGNEEPVRGKFIDYDAACLSVDALEAVIAEVRKHDG